MKRIIFILITGFCLVSLNGQQQTMFSQYDLFGYLVNPALTGINGNTEISLGAREQWIGVESPPQLHALAFQTRLGKPARGRRSGGVKKATSKFQNTMRRPGQVGQNGLGFFIYDDRNGLLSKTGLQVAYAYYIPMDDAELSFGLSGYLYQFQIKKQDAITADPIEPILQNDANNAYIPDFNFGLNYSYKEFYIGLAANNMIKSATKLGNFAAEDYITTRHYYIVSAYGFYFEKFGLEPSTFIRITENHSIQADISFKSMFRTYWAGLKFRTGSNDLGIFLGGDIRKFRIGYAWDFPFSTIRQYSAGSHELILGLIIK